MSEVKVNKISPRTNCGTVTLGDSGDTFTIPAGATITNSGTAAGFGSTGEVSWDTTKKTTGFTATSGVGYFCDTTSASFTVTLPATPSAGNVVAVADYNGTVVTNPITVGRNGSNINASANDFTISKNFSAVQFIYIDATVGWQTVFTGNTADVENTFIVATGGTITCCGNYKIHTFTGPGTFTVTNAGTPTGSNSVDYLVVAGGGAGGVGCSGGGGGAGGFRESSGAASGCYTASPLGACVSALPVTAQGYPITVGGGGPGIAPFTGPTFPSPTKGGSGSNSIFSTITSASGGGGGGNNEQPGLSGGSGGGGAHFAPGNIFGTGNTPPVSPPQGNNGANPAPATGSAPSDSGGGGGGAGGAAIQSPCGPQTYDHQGGAGVTSSITGSPVARAGGGGGTNRCGGGANDTDGGTGGGGKGGYGSRPTPNPQGSGVNGTANTGGGGGGGKALTSGASCRPYGGSGSGGSGIVIIRYKFQ